MTRIKHGDLIAIKGEARKYVALNITDVNCPRGLRSRVKGIHLFGGYWYGGDPLNPFGYGKMLDLKYVRKSELRVVGRVRTAYAALRHCR